MKQRCSICLKGELTHIGIVKSPYISQEYKLYQCILCQSRSFDVNEHPEVDLSCHYNARSEGQDYLRSTFCPGISDTR